MILSAESGSTAGSWSIGTRSAGSGSDYLDLMDLDQDLVQTTAL